jgi:transposase
MVWACFSWINLGPLVLIRGSITGKVHSETLRDYAIPTLKKFFPHGDGIFQEDNAPVHTAKIARAVLTKNNITLLPWPAYSPDLNLIENLWAYVEEKIRNRHLPPSSISQLEEMIQEEWQAIDQNYLQNLIESMPRRIEAVIAAKGGATKY